MCDGLVCWEGKPAEGCPSVVDSMLRFGWAPVGVQLMWLDTRLPPRAYELYPELQGRVLRCGLSIHKLRGAAVRYIINVFAALPEDTPGDCDRIEWSSGILLEGLDTMAWVVRANDLVSVFAEEIKQHGLAGFVVSRQLSAVPFEWDSPGEVCDDE